MSDDARIFTVGHSTLPLETFIDLLRAQGVALLADVRRYPASRRHPHFNANALEASLAEAGIRYAHFEDLGGRRTALPRTESPNTGWRNESFRGYADYMQAVEFEKALARLEDLAQRTPTAIMCAEAVPWRCHRNLIADALTARGWQVRHITSKGGVDAASSSSTSLHTIQPFARIDEEGRLTYPGEPADRSTGEQPTFEWR